MILDDDDESDGDEMNVDDEWTLDAVADLDRDTVVPSKERTQQLIQEYEDRFKIDLAVTEMHSVYERTAATLGVDISTPRQCDLVDEGVKTEFQRLHKLRWMAGVHGMEEDEICGKLDRVARILCTFMDTSRVMARLAYNCVDSDVECGFPSGLEGETIYDAKEKDLNSFQNAFCYLRKLLEGRQLRRAGDSFFERLKTASNYETMAFQKKFTISDFVAMNTRHNWNLKAWKWITDSPKNHENLVNYLQHREVDEVPRLKENRYLRSYEGDDRGRGAGVYDCLTDVFFDYSEKDDWEQIARDITTMRRQYDPAYHCAAPRAEDVTVKHMDCTFPFDIEQECREVVSDWKRVWREAHAFECLAKDALASAAPLVAELAACIADGGSRQCAPVVWYARPVSKIAAGEQLFSCALSKFLDELSESGRPLETDEATLQRFTGSRTVPKGRCVASVAFRDRWYVPTHCQARRASIAIPPERWQALASDDPTLEGRLTAHSFVVVDGKHLKPCTGRAWDDCETPEIDHLLDCQKFVAHDKFMVWALLGRLFFPVGKLDNHEMTFMIEGAAGTGKTTIMKAWQQFWPSHLRGIMSANMQPQFGMSSVAELPSGEKAHVCFCGEVKDDLSIVQEEWQDAVSGAEVSLARKFKDPLVMKWEPQIFWVGNMGPTRFNNDQGQVSRRLPGVLMAHPIKERNGSIMQTIQTRLGSMQRKAVLAYFEFVRLTGTMDPMSKPDQLPPAFASYYRRSKRRTNPMEDFLDCGEYVVLAPGESMPMSVFKDSFEKYRSDNSLGKIRWGEDLYRTSFHERSLKLEEVDGFEYQGEKLPKGYIIKGLTRA